MTATLSRRTLLSSVTAVLAAGFGLPVYKAWSAAGSEVFTGIIRGVGAGGHDVVAYHAEGRPVAGWAAITHGWNGATWRFASLANRDAFASDPARYAPAYGGHCAWAAAQGYKAKGDPRHWRIVDGRLFLNYDASVQRTWNADIPRFIVEADGKWPQLSRK